MTIFVPRRMGDALRKDRLDLRTVLLAGGQNKSYSGHLPPLLTVVAKYL